MPNVLNVQAPPIRFWPEGALDMNLVEAALLETGRSAIKPDIERRAGDDGGLASKGSWHALSRRRYRPEPSHHTLPFLYA